MTIELTDPTDNIAPQPIDLHPVQNYTFLSVADKPLLPVSLLRLPFPS